LIQHLHSCLLIDGSTTVVDLALTILIMFIPHITTSLVNDLPKLFLIYARIVCWDQYSRDGSDRQARSETSESEQGSEPELSHVLHFDPTWDSIDCGIDGVQSVTPKANYLFTFLYGLFPLNFMNFVRKPRRYLKMKSYPNAGDLDFHGELIKTRTEIHRTQHRLHPNFFTTTPGDELTDNRWLKSDPADLVTECLGLCIAIATTFNDPGPPPTTKLPELPKRPRKQSSRSTIPIGDEETILPGTLTPVDIMPSNSWRNTQSSTLTTSSTYYHVDALKLPVRQSSRTTLLEPMSFSSRNTSPPGQSRTEDMVESPIEMRPQTPKRGDTKTGASAPPSPPRLATTPARTSSRKLQNFAQGLSRFPMPTQAMSVNDIQSTAILQRELMILKNDLNFERFQKQKYLEQIGHLHRKHIGEITVESDTQNLINKNRTLKGRLARADERHEQLKKEMATSRSQAKKFEDQQSARLKNYKEDERKWQIESQTLRHELDIARNECEGLKKLVVESERREHDYRNQLGALEHDMEEVNSLRTNLLDLEAKLREYELRDLEFERTKEEHENLGSELETTRLKLNSADSERERMRRQYEQKILSLEANARQSSQAAPGQLSASVQQMIDSALAASQSKLLQMRKNYTQLHHKFLELEIRNQELESQGQRPGSVLSLTKYADDAQLSTMGPGKVSRLPSVKQHDFAEPLILEEPYASQSLEGIHQQQQQGSYLSPTSPMALFAERPSRFDRSMTSQSVSPDQLSAMERVSTHDFQAHATEMLSSSSKSTYNDASSIKVQPQSEAREARVYGRGEPLLIQSTTVGWKHCTNLTITGGAQNLSKKKENVLTKKDRVTKTGGFRGLKGIM
jgi:Hamartin protein